MKSIFSHFSSYPRKTLLLCTTNKKQNMSALQTHTKILMTRLIDENIDYDIHVDGHVTCCVHTWMLPLIEMT